MIISFMRTRVQSIEYKTMKKHLICLTLLFCLTELSAQSVEYEFENRNDPTAFQEFKKSNFYVQCKKDFEGEHILLWKRINKDVMVVVVVKESGDGISCFTIQFCVWDDATWRYANELTYSTGSTQLVPAKVSKDGKAITIYSRSGDVIISTEIPGMIFPGGM